MSDAVKTATTMTLKRDYAVATSLEGTSTQGVRRRMLRVLFVSIIVVFYICFLTKNHFRALQQHATSICKLQFLSTSPAPTPEERAIRILIENPLIDGHDDLLSLIRAYYKSDISSDEFRRDFEQGRMYGHVDLPRLRQGRSAGSFWSAWRACPTDGNDFSDENYAQVVKETYELLDLALRLQGQYPAVFTPSSNADAATTAFTKGAYISPTAIEGMHQIGNSISNLREYFRLGARYATLTHNCHNIYADAALLEVNGTVIKSTPLWHGVSTEGIKLINEMNRIGMIVDISHVSPDTMRDVLAGSAEKGWRGSLTPPIFSHSSAYTICPHPRNVPDDVLQLVRQRDSLVMVNVAPEFISCVPSNSSSGIPDFFPANNTITQVVKHIKHIGDLIGYDHVGIGSDFDGIPSVPRGFEDVSKFPALVAEMLRQGISDQEAAKVVGRNLLRVWAEVDRVSLQLQSFRQ